MDITVKHNGINITAHVLSYDREHKICTGIGILTLEVERTINRTFDPWDSIDIWENGSFQVRYYISAVEDSVPEGKLKIDCQDKSKKLVDFFIPASYNIDYPSYTRYWIEKFLTDAGITYEFNTTSSGNLLSNNTQLGLKPAYEEILTLLQLSGWYFYFDGNGKAIIGPLQTDLADTTRKIEKHDIMSISKVSDDKMLRNRALVLGAFDPYSLTYSTADVTLHTRWNYDNRDVRAMVVINSNIPNKGSAYSIANTLLKEFARITVEKHIVATGARNFNLGEALRVNSNVWRGKGLITTFGVRMSKDGLLTDIVLDERCPRLFGFFDFGDYVYVGTYGNGIWRKHLKFDPTWYNFSTGLTNLNITDLHINNGVFGSIGANGEMYYTLSEEGGWNQVTITGLMSSLDSTSASGITNPATFSGIMGRAVIVDKQANIIRYGVDNARYTNYGDYFIDYSGWTTAITSGVMLGSGLATASGWRGWIVEYDFFTGSGVTSYPISVSGDYNVRVLDLENDGFNDYVSIATGGGSIIPIVGDNFNYGSALISATSLNDENSYVGMGTTDTYELEGETLNTSPNVGVAYVIDNEATGERDIVGIETGPAFSRIRFTIAFNPTLGRDEVSTVVVTSSTQIGLTNVFATQKMTTDVYRFYQFVESSDVNNIYYLFEYRDWNAATNTAGSDVTIGTLTVPKDLAKTFGSTFLRESKFLMLKGKIWFYVQVLGTATNSTTNPTNYEKFYLMKIDLLTSAIEFNGIIGTINFHNRTATDNWSLNDLNGSYPHANWLLRNGEFPSIAIFVIEFKSTASVYKETWLIHSDFGTDFETISIQTTTLAVDPTFLSGGNVKESSQLTRTGRILYHRRTSDGLSYVYNGTLVSIVTLTSVPIQYQNSKIVTILGKNDNHYIVHDGSNWYFATPFSLALGSQITFPARYTVRGVFKTTSSLSEMYFWRCRNDDTSREEIVRMTTAGFHSSIIPFDQPGALFTSGFIVGNIFTNGTNALYVNNANEAAQGTTFLVLRRDGSDFTIIEEEAYPIRTDISNLSPVLTVGSGDATLKSNYVYPDSLEVIFAITGSGRQVEDYRYTLLEPTFSGVLASGLGIESIGLYVSNSGVFGENIRTYSGGWQSIFTVPSGWGKRIETSNYGLGGQYVFVTSSGFVQTFYQKNPDQISFTAYSGMPQARATIIRLDDRI